VEGPEKKMTELPEQPVSQLRFELGTYVIQVHIATGTPTCSKKDLPFDMAFKEEKMLQNLRGINLTNK
jgi:hypothetical protein